MTSTALDTLVAKQAEDEALWLLDASISEAYLQQALRRLHAAVETRPLEGARVASDGTFVKDCADCYEQGAADARERAKADRDELQDLLDQSCQAQGDISAMLQAVETDRDDLVTALKNLLSHSHPHNQYYRKDLAGARALLERIERQTKALKEGEQNGL